MGRLFGTDGVRGIAISEFTTEAAMLIGRAVAYTLSNKNKLGERPKILIGKDTRISCNIIESALIAGICSAGVDVCTLGIIPTPAVAYLTVMYDAVAGIVISAAHNTFEFNGLKIFNSKGQKISVELENEIERLVFDAQDEMLPAGGTDLGRVYYEKNGVWDYVRRLLKCADVDLSELRIVVDAANGAAYDCAKKFFSCLGAKRLIMINDAPNGLNINSQCGSTNVAALSKAVVANKAAVGLALNGDGDRCLIVDEAGKLIDGDKMLAILAGAMKKRGLLQSNTCVVTPMTNLGFFPWAKQNGIVVSTAPNVGAGYVFERMVQDGYNLGGEQSGYIILRDYATGGDGLLVGAKILELLVKTNMKASELGGIFQAYPQITVNVRLRPDFFGSWEEIEDITKIIGLCSSKLGDDGRVFVRESGTEPYLRIMVEGKDAETVYKYAAAIAQVARERIGEE